MGADELKRRSQQSPEEPHPQQRQNERWKVGPRTEVALAKDAPNDYQNDGIV